MKALLKGAYGTKNFGDDLLMLIAHDVLRKGGLEVDVILPGGSYQKKLDASIKANSVNKRKNYEFLVYGGGTQFYHFDKKNGRQKIKFSHKLNKIFGLISSCQRMKSALMRRLRDVSECDKTIYLGVGIGPFFSGKEKDIQLAEFKCGSFISVRDYRSLSYLAEVGIDAILGADIFFTEVAEKYIKIKDCKKVVDLGIVLRDWDNSIEGVVPTQFVDDVVQGCKLRGKTFKFIFMSGIHDATWIKFCRSRKYPFVVWDPESMLISQFVDEFLVCRSIVSSRFHGLVMASILRIPFIGLDIEPKISIFSTSFGEDVTVSYPYKADECLERLDELTWRPSYSLVVDEFQKRANLMVDKLYGYLR